MARSEKFNNWLRVYASKMMGQKSVEEVVDEQMQPHNLRVEHRTERGWEAQSKDNTND